MSLDSGIAEINFWSYSSGLADLPGSQEVLNLNSPTRRKAVVEKPKEREV